MLRGLSRRSVIARATAALQAAAPRSSNAQVASLSPHASRALATAARQSDSGGGGDNRQSWLLRPAALALSAAVTAGGIWAWQQQQQRQTIYADLPSPGISAAHCEADGAKVYTKDEVAKHKTKQDRIWVTYKDGVYDITDFVAGHPGGPARIMMAAGGPVDPFWAMYAQHQNKEVRALLEQYRIGDLKPFNAETPRVLLGERLNTPNELFYVRSHLPTPVIDPKEYRLTIEGEGVDTVELTLEELQTKFRKHTVAAALQCTGNRRKELKEVKPMQGLDWDVGAIGNAEWAGARLSDVLKYAGFDMDSSPEVEHIQFEGYDDDGAGTNYGASIPMHRGAVPFFDVILAYEMNSKELPRDHGYPVRVITPGITGARAVKWVRKIVPSRKESDSHWQQKDYKSFNPGVGVDDVDWSSAPAIQDVPVQSAITDPPAGSTIDPEDNEVILRGYAWSGSGNGIIRVDVTADGGKTWIDATLHKHDISQKRGSAWAWTLWEATVPLAQADRSRPLQVAVRAVDGSYNVQPEAAAPLWNLRGAGLSSLLPLPRNLLAAVLQIDLALLHSSEVSSPPCHDSIYDCAVKASSTTAGTGSNWSGRQRMRMTTPEELCDVE